MSANSTTKIRLAAVLLALWVTAVVANRVSGDSPGAGNAVYQTYVEDRAFRDGLGVFTVATGIDHPDGEGREVLFGEDGSGDAATSYITLRSYTTGTDYVQTRRDPGSGNLVTELDQFGVPESLPAGQRVTYDLAGGDQADRLSIITWLTVEGTGVDDSLVRLTTTVANVGDFPVEVGVRYLLDVAPYGDDGPERAAPGSGVVSVLEADLAPGSKIDLRSSVPHDGPDFEVSTSGAVASDRAVYAYWPDAFGFAWDYTSRDRDIATEGGLNDTALLYYFGATRDTALRIDPGDSTTVEVVLRGASAPVQTTPAPTPGDTPTPSPPPLRMPVALPRTGGR